MKKKNALVMAAALLATGLALTSGANANSSLYVIDAHPQGSTLNFATTKMVKNGFAASELSFEYGVLAANGPGTVIYTYLGSDAGYQDAFATFNGIDFSNYGAFGVHTVGSTYIQKVTQAGVLDFNFQTIDKLSKVTNAQDMQGNNPVFGKGEGVFGIVQGSIVAKKNYAYLLIYNDALKGGDHDFNDLVVGVNFAQPVPEPESYAMLLAGFGLLGAVVRRRRSRAAA